MTYEDICRRNIRLYTALERSNDVALVQQIKYEIEQSLDKLEVMIKTSGIERKNHPGQYRKPVVCIETGVVYESLIQAGRETGKAAAHIWYQINKKKNGKYKLLGE